MKASFLFKQYVWLVDTIQRCKRITLADLNERWLRTELSEGRPLSRTTFNRLQQKKAYMGMTRTVSGMKMLLMLEANSKAPVSSRSSFWGSVTFRR